MVYGIRGTPLKLIESFLANHFQYVNFNGTKFNHFPVTRGVPQGSTLAPLLFLIFINDIVNSSSLFHFSLFADDTCLYLKNPDLVDLYEICNVELKKVGEWILSNGLSLNVDKTVYIIFSGRKKIRNLQTLKIFDKPIVKVEQTKFLGLIIDSKLSWKPHTNFVRGKISRLIGVLYKIGNCLTLDALKTIYHSLLFPHFNYGIIFWSAVSKTEFLKMFRLQKKVLRLITKSPKYSHTDPIFKSTRLLKLEDVVHLEMCKFISVDISTFNNFGFTPRSVIHSYNTRQNSSLNLPIPHNNILLNSVFYKGIKIYNDLPPAIKNLNDKNKFKETLKSELSKY